MGQVRRLSRYCREYRRLETLPGSQTQDAEARLLEDFQDIYWAHMLYSTPERVSERWLIEARILARLTDAEIASSNRCKPGMIDAYEKCFSNVRADPTRPDYILQAVFGESLDLALNERDYGLLWKLLGYYGGPAEIDAMTRRLINPSWAADVKGVSAFFREIAISAVKQKAAIVGITIPVNGQTGLALIDSFAQYRELENASNADGSESGEILSNVSAMLGIMRHSFKVGSNVGVLKQSPLGERLGRGAVELRGDELIRVATGQAVPDYKELESIKFPELS